MTNQQIVQHMRCSTLTRGPHASRPCMICDKAVCPVGFMRAHSMHVMSNHTNVRLQKCRYRDLSPHYSFDTEWLYDRRFKSYCDNCYPKIMADLRAGNETGKVPTCHCLSLAHAVSWVCVPCLQQMNETLKKTAGFLCASRRKVAGCLGAASGRAAQGICRWCYGTGPIRQYRR